MRNHSIRGEKGIWNAFLGTLSSFAAQIELAARLPTGKEKHCCGGHNDQSMQSVSEAACPPGTSAPCQAGTCSWEKLLRELAGSPSPFIFSPSSFLLDNVRFEEGFCVDMRYLIDILDEFGMRMYKRVTCEREAATSEAAKLQKSRTLCR